jgi:hypothetical protein
MVYRKEGMMRAHSVMAALLCFLAVVAPHPSAAQAKAAVRVIKQAPRWVYVVGEGWRIDPSYKLYGKWVGIEVSKLPVGKWGKAIAEKAGTVGTTMWLCDLTGWCHKQK